MRGAGLRWEDVDLDSEFRSRFRGTLIRVRAGRRTQGARGTLQVPMFVLDVLRKRHSEAREGAVFVFEQRRGSLAYNSAR